MTSAIRTPDANANNNGSFNMDPTALRMAANILESPPYYNNNTSTPHEQDRMSATE